MVGEGPGPKRHATLPQFWIQRENWEFETHRMTLGQADPFRFALEETEVAAGACPPFVIRRQTDASICQNALHPIEVDVRFLEGKPRRNIGFRRDVTFPRFISSNANIGSRWCIANPGVRLEFPILFMTATLCGPGGVR